MALKESLALLVFKEIGKDTMGATLLFRAPRSTHSESDDNDTVVKSACNLYSPKTLLSS